MVPLKRAIAYDAPRVVINEIMYNPQSDVDGDEFLEIYNTTASTIDISGWCFTRGITLCFDSGTSLAGHAYGAISRDATQTLATYGVATIGTYTGKLDNGGERITLVDEASQVVVDFTYDDVSPWPTSPDGTGPSLELKDPTFDYTLASSWAASIGSPTPLADNSVLNLDLPELSNVSQASAINANDSVTITATVANGADVELVYKVAFDSDQTIAMYDDGAHGDGASGDDVYGGVIPGQEAGTLIRYKVQATNNNGTASKPSNDDSINYYGYMVRNPSQSVDAPTINWFIDDTDYDQLIQETVDTPPNEYPCVIVYGDQVFDNARVRIKGEYSSQLQFAKRPYKVTLPTGYTLSIPEISPYPLRRWPSQYLSFLYPFFKP